MQTAFSLRYQDIVIGTGKDAEANKIYRVTYTGWLAADGHKFDSSYTTKSRSSAKTAIRAVRITPPRVSILRHGKLARGRLPLFGILFVPV